MPVVSPSIPANIRAYLSTLFGERAPITNGDLDSSDVEALRAAAKQALAKGQSLDYNNYPLRITGFDGRGWGDTLKQSLSDPAYRMATTVGAADLKRDAKGNVHVVDTYDFNKDGPGRQILDLLKRGEYRAALSHLSYPTEMLDALGYAIAPETAKSPRPVNINLGPLGQLLQKSKK